MILDIHTHHPLPQPEGIVSLSVAPGPLSETEAEKIVDSNPQQLFSVGLHPWHTEANMPDDAADFLYRLALRPNVAAVGECGLDTLKGAPMFRQMNLFRMQIELSERVAKPLIIHDVKAHDIVLGLRRDLRPRQPWVIHGFRAKPTVAAMFANAGCYLSFGQHFNSESLKKVEISRILAETDESLLPISDIISLLEQARGESLREKIAENTLSVIGK